jgi:hypothetical protein
METQMRGQFASEHQEFKAATDAFNRVMESHGVKPTPPDDMMLAQAFLKLSDPGQAVGRVMQGEMQELGSLRQRLETFISRGVSGTLPGDLRNQIIAAAKRAYAIHVSQHYVAEQDARRQAMGLGLNADNAVPPMLSAYGQAGGRPLSQQRYREYMQEVRKGGVSPGQAYIDLADKGYYPQGGRLPSMD